MSSFQDLDFSEMKWETADIPAGWIQGDDMPTAKQWHVLGKYQVDRLRTGSYHRIYAPSEWGGMVEMLMTNGWVDSFGEVYIQYSRCLDHDLEGVLVRGIKPRAIESHCCFYHVFASVCVLYAIFMQCNIYASQLGITRWFQLLGFARSLGLVWFVWFHAPRFSRSAHTMTPRRGSWCNSSAALRLAMSSLLCHANQTPTSPLQSSCAALKENSTTC